MAQESFRSWQSRSIDQKQSASRLMLGLSAGALAFSTTLLSDGSSVIGVWQSWVFHLHGLFQLVAIGCGVAFSLNRVRDFDMTAQVARLRETGDDAARLSRMRNNLRRWGRITRQLYFSQSIMFLGGTVLFVLFVLLHYSEQLYGA